MTTRKKHAFLHECGHFPCSFEFPSFLLIFFFLLFLHGSLFPQAPPKPARPDSSTSGHVFRFKFEKDDVYVVDKYQDITTNSGLPGSREEKNKITLRITESTANASRMAGNFLTYSRSPRLTGEYRQDRSFDSI